MEKIFCEKCSSKRIVFGLSTKLVKDKLIPAITAICSECKTVVNMPEYSFEDWIIEDLEDHAHLSPSDYVIARAYPVELLLELDSHNKGESMCCGGRKDWSVLPKENAIKCHDCGGFYNPIHIIQQQHGFFREQAVQHLVGLQYSRMSTQE